MANEAGEIVICFGGAQGIGKACCESLLSAGCKVILSDIQDEKGQQTVKELKEKTSKTCLSFKQCDITNEDDVKGVFEFCKTEYERNPDIVFCAAGVMYEGVHWKKTINVNLIGTMTVIQEAMMKMGKNKGGNGGQVVVVSSVVGIVPFAYMPSYAASKFGINGFIRSLGTKPRYDTTGIRFNSMCPEAVDTDMVRMDRQQLSEHGFEGIFLDEFLTLREGYESMSPSLFAECLIKLIRDKDANGRCMWISKARGGVYLDLKEKECFAVPSSDSSAMWVDL